MRQLDEFRPQAHDLLLGGWTQIISGNDRAQPPGSGDGLKSRDTRADHQHPRRRDRARRGGQHGE